MPVRRAPPAQQDAQRRRTPSARRELRQSAPEAPTGWLASRRPLQAAQPRRERLQRGRQRSERKPDRSTPRQQVPPVEAPGQIRIEPNGARQRTRKSTSGQRGSRPPRQKRQPGCSKPARDPGSHTDRQSGRRRVPAPQPRRNSEPPASQKWPKAPQRRGRSPHRRVGRRSERHRAGRPRQPAAPRPWGHSARRRQAAPPGGPDARPAPRGSNRSPGARASSARSRAPGAGRTRCASRARRRPAR